MSNRVNIVLGIETVLCSANFSYINLGIFPLSNIIIPDTNIRGVIQVPCCVLCKWLTFVNYLFFMGVNNASEEGNFPNCYDVTCTGQYYAMPDGERPMSSIFFQIQKAPYLLID